MVIDCYRFNMLLVGCLAYFFLGQTELEGFNVVFHFFEFFFLDCVLATDLFERDVILGHFFEFVGVIINYYNEEFSIAKGY